MSVPVPFGQYVPVDSPVHRLDARAKLGLAAAYTVMLFFRSRAAPGFAIAAVAVAGRHRRLARAASASRCAG